MALGEESEVTLKTHSDERKTEALSTQPNLSTTAAYYTGSFAPKPSDSEPEHSKRGKALVKSLDRENTILIQKNPKSKIKLVVLDKYKQMIQNNSNKSSRIPIPGAQPVRLSNQSSILAPNSSEVDPLVKGGELPNLTFSVSQFNPKQQKYSITDTANFKPRASSLSNRVQLSDTRNRNYHNLIARKRNSKSDPSLMGSSGSVENSQEINEEEKQHQAVDNSSKNGSNHIEFPEEMDVLSDSIVASKPPKSDRRNKSSTSRSHHDSKSRTKSNTGLHRGITMAAAQKNPNADERQDTKKRRSTPLGSRSFANEESRSGDLIKSQDDTSLRMSSNSSKTKHLNSSDRESRDRSKSQSDFSRKTNGQSHTRLHANEKYVSPYEKGRSAHSREPTLNKLGHRSAKRDTPNASASSDVIVASSRSNSRLNFSEPFEINCGVENHDSDASKKGSKSRGKREVSSPIVLSSARDGKEENNSENEDCKVTVRSTGVLSNRLEKRERGENKNKQLCDGDAKVNNNENINQSSIVTMEVFSKGKAFNESNGISRDIPTKCSSNAVATNNETSSEKQRSEQHNKDTVQNQRPEDVLNSTENDRVKTTRLRPAKEHSQEDQAANCKGAQNKTHLNIPGNERVGSDKPNMHSHNSRASVLSKSPPRSRGPSNSRSVRSTSGKRPVIKATPIAQAAQIHPKQVASNPSTGSTMKGTGGYAKRGKPRVSTTVKPSQEAEKKSASAKKKREDANGETFSDGTDKEDNEEHYEVRPPLPSNARIPPVITDPSVHPYDATEKCIKSLAKHPLDIDFGAWHRNVLPTLPPLVRNPQSGRRYIELPNQFYACRGNNTILVENHFVKHMQWTRTEERGPNYKFKWMQCVNQIDYDEFRDSEQVANHISNISCLTTKIGLVESLRAYERHLQQKVERKPNTAANNDLKMVDFFNETFKLNNKTENAAFRETYKAGETWICKPNGLNQGIGIFLMRSLEDLDAKLNDLNSSKKSSPYKQRSHNYDRMIQRYIEHPLLLDNKKIDIRAYMLIASTAPFVVLYHPGYLRLCIDDYKLDDNSLIGHLNNQYIQKKDPRYKKLKDDTVWSYERANDYINEHYMKSKGIEEDWWYKVFEKQAKRIMLHCFQAVKCTLKSRIGTFDLLGFDFMIDENMKVYLIEINVNPALATNCQVLDQVIPPMVHESIDVVMEIWEKARRGLAVSPIQSRQNMEILYNEAMQSKYRRSQHSAKMAANFSNASNSTNPNSSTASKESNNSTNSQNKSASRFKSQSPNRDNSLSAG